MMREISADEVVAFVTANAGTRFETRTDKSPFFGEVHNGCDLEFIPDSPRGRNGRGCNRAMLERCVAIFNQNQDYVTTPYAETKMQVASYFVAVVEAMLEHVPQIAPIEVIEPPQPLPHDIEGELSEFVSRSSKGGKTERNAEFVVYYYGFRGHPFPTFEDTGAVEGLTRQAPAAIFQRDFQKKATLDKLPSTAQAAALLQSLVPIGAVEYLESLRKLKLIVGGCSARGLLRLFEDLSACMEIRLYDQELAPVNTVAGIEEAEALFFLTESQRDEMHNKLQEIRATPGEIGIAHFRDVEIGDLTTGTAALLRQLVESSPRFWTMSDGDSFWFMCEDGEKNALRNNLFKVASISDGCPIQELAEALHQGFRPGNRDYPPAPLITAYLAASRFVEVRDGMAYFRKSTFKPIPLTEVQAAAAHILVEFGSDGAALPAIAEKLRADPRNFGRQSLVNAITNSPVVCASGKRPKKVYRLVTLVRSNVVISDEARRLERFRERLRRIGEAGTDVPVNSKRRREHECLTEFVFGDSSAQPCALCGQVLPVQALIVAHKTPRYRCRATQKIDPHSRSSVANPVRGRRRCSLARGADSRRCRRLP